MVLLQPQTPPTERRASPPSPTTRRDRPRHIPLRPGLFQTRVTETLGSFLLPDSILEKSLLLPLGRRRKRLRKDPSCLVQRSLHLGIQSVMFPQSFLSRSTVLTISLTSSNSYNPQNNLVNLALSFKQILQTWKLWLREVPEFTQAKRGGSRI